MNIDILKYLFQVMTAWSKSTLEVNASQAVEVTGGGNVSGGLTVQGLKIIETSDGKIEWFDFIGAGVGVSLGPPIGGSFSDESYEALYAPLIKGPSCWGKLNFDDLSGQGHVFSISAAALETKSKGVGLSIVTFGETAGEPILCSAVTIFAGLLHAVPGAGIMAYKGVWRKVGK